MVTSTNTHVKRRQLAHGTADELAELRSRRHAIDQGQVLVPDAVPVDTVHPGVVEVVAVDSPGFVEDLRPLGPWLDFDLNLVRRDLAFAGFDLVAGIGDAPGSVRPDQ